MNPSADISISRMPAERLDELPALQPEGWNDITTFFKEHHGREYFFPIQAMMDKELVGIGQLILTADAAWLGNIIVRPEFRRQGIGESLTSHLMAMAGSRGRKLMLLLATPEGQELYGRLQFRAESSYMFYRKEGPVPPPSDHPHIARNVGAHNARILELDYLATGENRSAILEYYLDDCWVYEKQRVAGFYIPKFGEGPIIADNPEAGTALMEKRRADKGVAIALPEGNREAIRYLEDEGYELCRHMLLMSWGEMKKWQPERIYGRVGGYLG